MLSDGPRLYIQENINGHFVISQVLASGGETVPIPTPFPNVTPLNISPDKSELLVGTFTGTEVDQRLWALPVLGGSPRRVSELTGWDGTWLPNGNSLIARNKELLELFAGGTRKFATLPDYSYRFRWSPDGQVLRFTVAESNGANSIGGGNSIGRLAAMCLGASVAWTVRRASYCNLVGNLSSRGIPTDRFHCYGS